MFMVSVEYLNSDTRSTYRMVPFSVTFNDRNPYFESTPLFDIEYLTNKKYVLSNSEYVQCKFFIFDYVTFIQFKICCCVQNLMKIGWFFADIWWYIDFQTGGCPPSWNCFTTVWHHPWSLCCWPQLAVLCQSDTRIWRYSYLNLSHIWLEMPIQATKMGVLGDFGSLNVIIHHRDPQKAHSCVNPRLLSYQKSVERSDL